MGLFLNYLCRYDQLDPLSLKLLANLDAWGE
jgi:hypothetical protein